MLLAYVALETLKHVAATRFGLHAATSAAFTDNNGWAFLQHLVLLQAIGPLGRAETFNIPAWSISVEFYTYLLFGALLLVLKGRRRLVSAGSLLALFSLVLLSTGSTFGWQYLLRGVTGFFLGCGISFVTEIRRLPLPRGSVFVAAGALVLFLSLKKPHEVDVAVFAFAALLVLCLVADGGTSRGALSWRSLRWLGDISYSLYMTHAIVLWVTNQTIRIAFGAPQALVEGVMTPQLSLGPALAATLVSLFLSLAVAQAMSALVERPWRLRSRRFVGLTGEPGRSAVAEPREGRPNASRETQRDAHGSAETSRRARLPACPPAGTFASPPSLSPRLHALPRHPLLARPSRPHRLPGNRDPTSGQRRVDGEERPASGHRRDGRFGDDRQRVPVCHGGRARRLAEGG